MSNTVLTGLVIASTERGDNSWWADAMSIGHINGAFRPICNTAIGRYVRYDFTCLVIIFIGKWIKNRRKAAPVDRVVSKRQKLEKSLEEDKIKERKSTSMYSASSLPLTSAIAPARQMKRAFLFEDD